MDCPRPFYPPSIPPQKVHGKRERGGPSRGPALGYFSLVTPGEATPDTPAVLKVTSLIIQYKRNADIKTEPIIYEIYDFSTISTRHVLREWQAHILRPIRGHRPGKYQL